MVSILPPPLLRALRAAWPLALGLALWGLMAWTLSAWVPRNGLPDGHQNEFLHVGNALDLWGAAVARDGWHLRYYLSTNYWPPGFYLWPWPLLAWRGATHEAMVLANLGHYALLLWASFGLGATLGGRRAGALAMLVVWLLPAVPGNLVRFEPNVPMAGWVACGALALLRTRGFTDARASLVFGAVTGLGLLMDRLTYGVFLAPVAAVEWGRSLARARPGERGEALKGGLSALGVALAIAGWWHVGFVRHHLDEILSQTDVGEIDAAGQLTEPAAARLEWLYYPLTWLDSQAGWLLGGLGLLALGAALARLEDPRRRVLALAVLLPTVALTLITKKQGFYTLPALGLLAALTGAWIAARPAGLRWGLTWLALIVGLHQQGLRLWGEGLPLPAAWSARLDGPRLPEALVQPRYPMALPPGDRALPVDAVEASLPEGDLVVFSEHQDWFEGYLVLQLRERRPGAHVRGVIGDPAGSYEWVHATAGFVYVSSEGEAAWPSEARVARALEQHHYTLDALPPLPAAVARAREGFRPVGAWTLADGGQVHAWQRE